MNLADQALLERDRELDEAIKQAEKALCKTREYLNSDGFKQVRTLEEGIKFEVIKLNAGIDISKEEIKNYTILPPKDVKEEKNQDEKVNKRGGYIKKEELDKIWPPDRSI